MIGGVISAIAFCGHSKGAHRKESETLAPSGRAGAPRKECFAWLATAARRTFIVSARPLVRRFARLPRREAGKKGIEPMRLLTRRPLRILMSPANRRSLGEAPMGRNALRSRPARGGADVFQAASAKRRVEGARLCRRVLTRRIRAALSPRRDSGGVRRLRRAIGARLDRIA